MTALPHVSDFDRPVPQHRDPALRVEPTRPQPGQHLIADASAAVWRARVNSRMNLVRRARARARIAVIDDMLNTLELRHLSGERTFDRLTRARLRRLEEQVGLPLPRKAVRARNTVRLHAALLDWQEQVLDEIAPTRREFGDISDSDWNAPTPDYSAAS